MDSGKKIKVLETIRQGKIGGGESHVLDLVAGLDKDIFEPVVLSFTPGPMVERLKELGIKTHVVETQKPFDFTKWEKVRKILVDEQIDIVHAHGTRANSNTFASARKLNIPIVYTVHGWSFHPDQNFLLRNLRIMGERYLVDKATVTICVSDNNIQDAQKVFPMKRAVVIKYGINLNKFNPEGSFEDLRGQLGIDKTTTLVGYIVRMTKQKDPLTLVRAIALIPESENVKFLFVGDGELKAPAMQLAQKLKIASRIHFIPFRQDVPNVLNAVDIYCLPSLWEGLPIGMLEAMAMRKAIITTSVDGAREVIRNGENGVLVEPQNVDQLAESIVQLVKSSTLRELLANSAYDTILHNFNVERMVKEIEALYFRTLNRN